jgi:hypothetical protein
MQENQKGMEVNDLNQVLVYGDDANLLGGGGVKYIQKRIKLKKT